MQQAQQGAAEEENKERYGYDIILDFHCPTSSETEIQKRIEGSVYQIGGAQYEKYQHDGGDQYACDLGGDLLRCRLHHRGGAHEGRDQKYRIAAEIVQSLRGDERNAARTEESAHVTGDTAKAVCVEDHEADDHNEQKIHAGQNPGELLQHLSDPELFHDQEKCEVQTPQNEVPVRSVPKSCQHPNHKEIEQPTERGYTVAAHGNIHVIPEPGAQGHMPSAPEFRYAGGDEGIVEVLNELKSEDPTETDSHIAVAREIEIDVQAEGDGVDPEEQNGLLIRFTEDVAQFAQRVGDQNLLRQTDREAEGTGGEQLCRVGALFQFCRDIGIPNNRTGDQLGEQGHVGSQIDIVSLCLRIAAVYVNDVTDALKGVKADTDGQCDLQKRDGNAEDSIQIGDHKVRVFEESQHQKSRTYADPQEKTGIPRAAEALNEQPRGIAYGYGRQHQQCVFGFTPKVEEQTEDEQDGVFQFSGSDIIQQKYCRKEIEQKRNT